MNEIRPVDLPELRAELVNNLASPEWSWYYEEQAADLNRFSAKNVTAEEVQTMEPDALSLCDLFFVSEGMYQLASAAAESLPPYTLACEDVPSRFGFAYLAPGTHHPKGWNRSIAAVEWAMIEDGVNLHFYCETEQMIAELRARGSGTPEEIAEQRRLMGRLSPFPGVNWIRFGFEPFQHAGTGAEEYIRTVRSIWLLMQQPLASIVQIDPDRATRKRVRRMGHEPGPVRVITLRRPKSSGEHGEGDREYHHQWIVRGHWRQQWYPAREVHRPVWIAPHVKGPEGAPLIGGEKVYALKR